jgi:hypothetical protein
VFFGLVRHSPVLPGDIDYSGHAKQWCDILFKVYQQALEVKAFHHNDLNFSDPSDFFSLVLPSLTARNVFKK